MGGRWRRKKLGIEEIPCIVSDLGKAAEEQNTCDYCNIKPGVYSGGNFGDKARFQLRQQNDVCRIGAWRSDDGKVIDMGSAPIRHCPMRGRKLGKEE